jgi:glycosyltransferase involved in cell wall biosynthesis
VTQVSLSKAKSRLKILHVGKFYPPDIGGIESVTSSLAEGAAAAGHDVTVACMGFHNASEVTEGGVCVERSKLAAQVASQPLSFRYLVRAVWLARHADIVHFHAPNMLGALAVLLAGRRPRLLVHWHSDVRNKGLLGVLLRPLELALLRRADRIIATSLAYAEHSPLIQKHSYKVSIVPIGVKDAATPANAHERLPEFVMRRLRGRSLVLSIGRLVPYKGFSVLVEAAKWMPDVLVVIVGNGPLKRVLTEASERAGVQESILFTGAVDAPTLSALLHNANLFCLPSVDRAEAFGVVLLEAMAHGLPVVATRIPGSGVSWVNLDGTSGINVEIQDSKALAEACNAIVEDPRLCEVLARGARDRYLSNFTENIFVAKVLAIYGEVSSATTPHRDPFAKQ